MNRRWFLRGVASLPFVGAAATLATATAPTAPALATGGVVPYGSTYAIGEHGPETVIPLRRSA